MNSMNTHLPVSGYIQPSNGFDAKRVFRVWRRHLGLFSLIFVAVMLVGGAVVFTLKPTYTATATVVLTTQDADPLAPEGQQPQSVVEDDRPATEAALLMSRDVASDVLRQYPAPPAAPSFHLRSWLCGKGVAMLCQKPVASTPQSRESGEITQFLTQLKVSPEDRSRVLDVAVTANTGPRAAELADAVVTNYQTIALGQQTANVSRIASWLDARTQQLRQRWLDAVTKANEFAIAKGLTNTGSGDATDPLVDSQIAETAVNLSGAQARLAAAQARADSLRQGGDPSTLVDAAQQPIVVSAANELAQLESQRGQQEAEYGRNYPGVRELNREIAATRASLNSATGSALGNIRSNLVAARAEVNQLTSYLNRLRAEAGQQSAPQAEYRSLTQEAQSAQTVYETFLDHSKEVVDRASLLEPPINFVSHAAIPGQPTFPNHPKLLAGVVVVAMVLAFAIILLIDYLSVGFGDVDDLRGSVQLPLLTAIPVVSASRRRLVARHVLDEPFSRASEAVRGLAAQLSLLVRDADTPRSLLVTSASAEEGKTTLVVWLALTVRLGGQKVLVVDGDHRRGSLMRHMSGSAKLGLTDLLAGRATLSEVIQTDPDTKVDFIAAGRPMTHSFGTGEIMRLRAILATLKTSYGLVIVDSPPLLAMTDGLVHASIVDQTIFVCRWQSTSRRAVIGCIERLRAYGAQIPGIVVSMVDQKSTLALGDDYSRRELKLINKLYGS
ncbi:GumC family protein [Acidisoma sp.]|uniref:GumC family protein n=1 Tax=Acidisoma sp. TaxID=1872115 RepID=UPI003AFFAA82